MRHPDMLEVGNGMTENEDRAHFTMWCMMASPLILGNDLRNMSDATRNIIMNKDMIAIDQDTLGIQGLHIATATACSSGSSLWQVVIGHLPSLTPRARTSVAVSTGKTLTLCHPFLEKILTWPEKYIFSGISVVLGDYEQA